MDKSFKYFVPNEIISNTERCNKDFACLEGKADLCEVEEMVNDTVLFIKCLNSSPCPYRITFGDGYICHCPTRKELYGKYHI